jgi:hypothetical protein
MRFYHSAHTPNVINKSAMREKKFNRFQQLLLTLKGYINAKSIRLGNCIMGYGELVTNFS